MTFNTFFNTLFGWAIGISPLFGISLIALVITLITTLAYKFFTDQNAIKLIRDEMQSIQKKIKESTDDKLKLDLSKQIWEKNMESMRHNLKPMIITFLPIIIIFNWLREAYAGYGALLFGLEWLGTYIILSILFSITLRKLFNVY